jgi:hypothetical protein
MGLVWVVAKRSPDFANSGIDAMVDINKNAVTPKLPSDFLSGYELTASLNQQDEQVHRTFLKVQTAFSSLQHVARWVEGELAEVDLWGRKSLRFEWQVVGKIMPRSGLRNKFSAI